MARFSFASLTIAATMLLGAGSAFATSQHCGSNQWWSDQYNTCYEKYGHCGQYNYTNSDTCNSGRDNLQCDWDWSSSTCYSPSQHGSDNHGGNSHDSHSNDWWSDTHHRWFPKQGYCGQYNHTDYNTCNSGKDWMQCDYDQHSGSCYESHH